MAGKVNIYGLPFCPSNMTVTANDVCDALFTRDGLACAHCTGASGCFDDIDTIYCTTGGASCLGDPACYHVNDGAEAKHKMPTLARRPK
jgi:hypothetical protein